jgi:hypothetical protein
LCDDWPPWHWKLLGSLFLLFSKSIFTHHEVRFSHYFYDSQFSKWKKRKNSTTCRRHTWLILKHLLKKITFFKITFWCYCFDFKITLKICIAVIFKHVNQIIEFWYHIISYHIISYHIISYHIISYHIISYQHLMQTYALATQMTLKLNNSLNAMSCHIILMDEYSKIVAKVF